MGSPNEAALSPNVDRTESGSPFKVVLSLAMKVA